MISALGASLVVRYAPASMRGFMMGVWFFASSLAGILAGCFAHMTDVPTTVHDPMISQSIYQHAFTAFGCISAGVVVIAGVIFYAVPSIGKISRYHVLDASAS